MDQKRCLVCWDDIAETSNNKSGLCEDCQKSNVDPTIFTSVDKQETPCDQLIEESREVDSNIKQAHTKSKQKCWKYNNGLNEKCGPFYHEVQKGGTNGSCGFYALNNYLGYHAYSPESLFYPAFMNIPKIKEWAEKMIELVKNSNIMDKDGFGLEQIDKFEEQIKSFGNICLDRLLKKNEEHPELNEFTIYALLCFQLVLSPNTGTVQVTFVPHDIFHIKQFYHKLLEGRYPSLMSILYADRVVDHHWKTWKRINPQGCDRAGEWVELDSLLSKQIRIDLKEELDKEIMNNVYCETTSGFRITQVFPFDFSKTNEIITTWEKDLIAAEKQFILTQGKKKKKSNTANY